LYYFTGYLLEILPIILYISFCICKNTVTLEDNSESVNSDSDAEAPAPEEVDPKPETSVSSQKCSEMRQKLREENEYMSIADTIDLPLWDIVAHIRGNCDCDADEAPVTENTHKPWAEKELVKELYIEQNYHFTEIGELFDCHHETVKNWARDYHEITIIDDSVRTSSKTVRELHRIGIQNDDDIDLPPEARESPFGSSEN